MDVILYSSGCPKCNTLKAKLDKKEVPYTISSDFTDLIAKGYRSAPLLSVDGEVKDFTAAISWVNNLE